LCESLVTPVTRRVTPFLLLAGILLGDDPAGAQDVESLTVTCGRGVAPLVAWCQEVALGFQALQRGIGLSVTGGSDLPGTGSTLGRRLGSAPRIAFTLKGNAVDLGIPRILDGTGAPAPEESFFIPSAQLGIRAGILDGFSLAPTIGGILSIDLYAELSGAWLPEDQGFLGNAFGYGIGARIGVFRESFTLPGVSLSVTRHSMGSVEFGDPAQGDHAALDFDLSATSVRAVASKSIQSLGLLAGAGWDRYDSDVELFAADPVSAATGQASAPGFQTDRVVYFAGASMTFLVLQISGELGWAGGSDGSPAGRANSGFDPESGTYFGGVALRLTF